LKGRSALALAGMAYEHFREVFEDEAFDRLEQEGAWPQYLLWASTGTKNPDYSDLLYVENLIAPRTINTLPDATLEAFADHGKIASMLKPRLDEDREVWAELAAVGIDMDGAVRDQLLDEGLEQFQTFTPRLAAIRPSGSLTTGSFSNSFSCMWARTVAASPDCIATVITR
ncbi:MAG: transaldolase family protein, partial [Thioalkalivibrio sp.]